MTHKKKTQKHHQNG